MKKIALAFVALFSCVSSVFAQEMENAAEKYNQAIEKIQAKDIDAAIPLLKEAMNSGIDAGEAGVALVKEVQGLLPKIYYQQAGTLAKGGKFDEAIKSFLLCEETADLYNDVTTRRKASMAISNVYMMQGAELFNTKDYKGALEIFKKGYTQDDSNVKLAAFTAKSHAELGELDQAIPLFTRVIEAGAANSKYTEDAAAAQKDLDQYVLVGVSGAVSAGDLDKAIVLADLLPTNATASMLVMQGANNSKKYDIVIARGDASAALQTDPASKSDIYYFIGGAYNSKENKAKAIEYLSKVSDGQFVAAAKTAVVELKK